MKCSLTDDGHIAQGGGGSNDGASASAGAEIGSRRGRQGRRNSDGENGQNCTSVVSVVIYFSSAIDSLERCCSMPAWIYQLTLSGLADRQ